MGTERKRLMVLGALVVVLLAVLYQLWGNPAGTPAAASNGRVAQPRAGRTTRAETPTAPDVHLDALDSERPKPGESDRNLFRFKVKAAPPPPPRVEAPVAARPAVAEPVGPPPPPPIPLKFIGIVQSADGTVRIAALVDPAGHPYHAAEGEVVAGQYRVLKIGVESVDIAYLDGRGRQTIRLNGA